MNVMRRGGREHRRNDPPVKREFTSAASKEARCVEEFTRGKLKEGSEVERGEVEEGK